MIIERLVGLTRNQKRILQLVTDEAAVLLALLAAWWLTLGTPRWGESVSAFLLAAMVMVAVTPFCMERAGTYRAVVRYAGPVFASRLVGACLWVAALGYLVAGSLTGAYQLRFLADLFILFLIFTSTPRLLVRWKFSSLRQNARVPALIYGAGNAGRQLANALQRGNRHLPVAFVDDDPALRGTTVMDLPVYAADWLGKAIRMHGVEVVLLAMPSAGRARKKAVLKALEQYAVHVQTVPGIEDIVSGQAKISELREVAIEDLLGRDPIAPYPDLIKANIFGKSVLITGAGGSIGSELAKQALQQYPEVMVLYEQCEYSLYTIEQELLALRGARFNRCRLVTVLGSVSNEERLTNVCRRYQVDTVYHAAAYKHVPLVEENPFEGLRNNFINTWKAALAAVRAGVETFVLVSTDKAVRPTNIMGASKRLAELAIQALSQRDTKTRFSIVRFGNVLGSSGSVVPKFRRQIASGGPVTVTHPEITRYFMTVSEAAQLVIQAGAMGDNGEVFVLDMGEPVKILDLARRMIRLSGLQIKDEENPQGDIEIKCTGLRPGEKLYEELLIGKDDRLTVHPQIRATDEPCLSYEQFVEFLHIIEASIGSKDLEKVYELLLSVPTAWVPQSETLQDHGVAPVATEPADTVKEPAIPIQGKKLA